MIRMQIRPRRAAKLIAVCTRPCKGPGLIQTVDGESEQGDDRWELSSFDGSSSHPARDLASVVLGTQQPSQTAREGLAGNAEETTATASRATPRIHCASLSLRGCAY
jgi:hypothetical protein